MKQYYSILFFCLFSLSASAQTANCDALTITDFKQNIFNSSEILVRASYSDFDNFVSYPGFQFLGTDESVLAFENVNFFGLGSDQVHVMQLLGPQFVAGEPISGTLELWSTFFEFLECQIDTSNLVLLEDTACYNVELAISSLGEIPTTGGVYWTITSESANVFLLDSAIFDGNETSFTITYCLPTACDYFLEIVPANIVGPGFVYNLHYRNFLALGAQGFLANDGINFEHRFLIRTCAEVPQSLNEQNEFKLTAFPNPANNQININWPANSTEVNQLLVFNALGQRVDQFAIPQNMLSQNIDCSAWPAGVYQFVLNGMDGVTARTKVVVSR
jgi:hypothetical protein